jgi:hypothetical protein
MKVKILLLKIQGFSLKIGMIWYIKNKNMSTKRKNNLKKQIIKIKENLIRNKIY